MKRYPEIEASKAELERLNNQIPYDKILSQPWSLVFICEMPGDLHCPDEFVKATNEGLAKSVGMMMSDPQIYKSLNIVYGALMEF